LEDGKSFQLGPIGITMGAGRRPFKYRMRHTSNHHKDTQVGTTIHRCFQEKEIPVSEKVLGRSGLRGLQEGQN
jgi:hypothetical protein